MYNRQRISITKAIKLDKQAMYIEDASFWINRQEPYVVDLSIYAEFLSLPSVVTIELVEKPRFTILYGSPLYGFHGELHCELIIPALSHQEIQQSQTLEQYQTVLQQLISQDIHATSCYGFVTKNHIDATHVPDVKRHIDHLLERKGLHVLTHMIHMNLSTQNEDQQPRYRGRNYLDEIGMGDDNV
jgi:hypothetical protein